GFSPGCPAVQPGISISGRTGAEPETYTYTKFVSPGAASTLCVCEPRQVCTLPTYFGLVMSEMSKMRMPRRRSPLIAVGTPPSLQSRRPSIPSPDTNRRCLYTETSLCDAGQKYSVVTTGVAGLEMSHTTKPLKLPWMAYLPVNARSELTPSSNRGGDFVVETS